MIFYVKYTSSILLKYSKNILKLHLYYTSRKDFVGILKGYLKCSSRLH